MLGAAEAGDEVGRLLGSAVGWLLGEDVGILVGPAEGEAEQQ